MELDTLEGDTICFFNHKNIQAEIFMGNTIHISVFYEL